MHFIISLLSVYSIQFPLLHGNNHFSSLFSQIILLPLHILVYIYIYSASAYRLILLLLLLSLLVISFRLHVFPVLSSFSHLPLVCSLLITSFPFCVFLRIIILLSLSVSYFNILHFKNIPVIFFYLLNFDSKINNVQLLILNFELY